MTQQDVPAMGLVMQTMAQVLQDLQAQRQALLAGDVPQVEAASERLRASVLDLRRQLASAPATGAEWQALLAQAASIARSNASAAGRRAQCAAQGLDHLSAWSPALEQRRLGGTYAPPGGVQRRAMPARSIGSA